jgi:hypothetical protein
METSILKIAGQVAGLAGLAIGLVIIIFREVIRKNIFPKLPVAEAYKVLRMVLILAWSTAIVGIGAWVLVSIAQPKNAAISIPGDTGWLLLGDIDRASGSYIRGPFYKIIKSNYPDKSALPRKDEWLELTAERNVIITDYRVSGLSKQLDPPWQKNVLDENDYTGIKLPKGSKVEVRDVDEAGFEGMPLVLWVRVGLIPR